MSSISDELKRAVDRQVESMMDGLSGVVAVVAATVDGFDVAHRTRGDVDASRIAAMASSIAAIGQVVSQEADLGASRSITVNTADGFAYISTVERPDGDLVLHVIARSDAILAQVVHATNAAARVLEAA